MEGGEEMSTVIRPEVSPKNRYYIDRHRYYELKHFCLQYPMWKKALLELDGFGHRSSYISDRVDNNVNPDLTAKVAEARIYYSSKIDLINETAKNAGGDFSEFVLKAVIYGYTYDYLRVNFNMPCCKDSYYEIYRRFFWLLNFARK